MGCRVSAGFFGAITYINQWSGGVGGQRGCRDRSDRKWAGPSWTLKPVATLWGFWIGNGSRKVAEHLDGISSSTQRECSSEVVGNGGSGRRGRVYRGWMNRIVIFVQRAVVAR